jgi:hypothetical protein
MGGGSGRRPRFGGGGLDSEEMDLSNLMSLYNAVKEEEKDRDEQIEKLDVSYDFLEKCIELIEIKPKIAHKFIKLPKLLSVIMFIAKCQHSYNDKVVETFISLIREFYDRPVYTPLLKLYYLDFIAETINRVDQDSINRGEFLQIFKAIGKKAGGIYTELGRDLKTFTRGKVIESGVMNQGQEESNDEEIQEDDEESDEEDDDLGELT